MSENSENSRPSYPGPQYLISFIILLAGGIIAYIAYIHSGWAFVVLFVLGFLIGYTLFHSNYGFATVYKHLIEDGNTQMLRGHMQKLIIATTLFSLILANQWNLFGNLPEGAVSPISIGLVLGSFIFGFGMNIGSNLGPSSMRTKKGGRTSLLFTLAGFLLGATIGAVHFSFWNESLPNRPGVSLADNTPLGYVGAWLVQIAIFAAIAFGTYIYKKRKRPPALPPMPRGTGWTEILFSTWPIWVGATVLATLNAAVLLVQGSPWKFTAPFTLWGSQIADQFGLTPSSWGYWGQQELMIELNSSVFMNDLSVLNFGVFTGTLLTMSLAGLLKFSKISLQMACITLLGGFLMGYGACISYGANVGAYFSGLASMSLHAWIWTVMAVSGVYTAAFLNNKFQFLGSAKEGEQT
ncbi:YeeE/YedE family protein [Alkalicoccus daliensis]|uniref:Uncharacterized protein n=1 Tax=Alkalicoccus daliensis TaxID=745820 RepID=A0A1H0E1V0_9BACI|nr:YeeE/YedE family protein [Alkalicoccus daliensis]SDN76253.1 hypothetical protein SAMN04488053_103171 [Alkalicoccus daliensis]